MIDQAIMRTLNEYISIACPVAFLGTATGSELESMCNGDILTLLEGQYYQTIETGMTRTVYLISCLARVSVAYLQL